MKLCIAHGGDVSEPSGGTDRVTAFASGLQQGEHEVILVVPQLSGELPDRLEPVDVRPVDPRTFGLSNAFIRASRVAHRARSIADREGARLQFEHSTLAGVGTVLGSRGYILDMHDLAFARYHHVDSALSPVLSRTVEWLERRAVRLAGEIVVVSDYMRTVLRQKWGVSTDRIHVIENGFYPDRIAELERSEAEPRRVCFLGTLHPKVDVATIVELAESPLVEELIVIGDGARRSDLERESKRIDALDVVGRLPDRQAFDLVASAEVVINPQTVSKLQHSSSPVKLYYYAALGKAMVVSEGPDVADELARQEAALTADTRSSFVECVERLLEDDHLAAKLGENAMDISENYKWQQRVTILETSYEELDRDGIAASDYER